MSERTSTFSHSLAFQKQILQYMVSSVSDFEGSKYLKLLEPDLFDLSELQVVCNCLQEYQKKYGVIPKTDANLLDFFSSELKKMSVSEQVRKLIEQEIRAIFDPLRADTPIIKEAILEFARYRRCKLAIETWSPRLKEGAEYIEKLERDLHKARTLSADEIEGNKNHGKFLIKDYAGRELFRAANGHPTFIHEMNMLTSARGFKSPELIAIMGAPKSFKTGFLLNVAKHYMLTGLNIYYADGENGHRSITNRMKQSLLECNYRELADGTFQQDLDSIMGKAGARGGDFICDHYPARTCTLLDVELRLAELKQERNFVPDFIVYDDLTHFNPIDSKVEPRLRGGAVYFDAIGLNTKLGCFAFTPAQVNRAAVSKKIITLKDIAEDFSKIMNAHGAFALCRTDQDITDGFARLVVVMQREGEPPIEGKEILLVIDAANQIVRVPNYEEEALLKRRWVSAEVEASLMDN